MDQEFHQFAVQVKKLTGLDLRLYKESQMNRRLRALYTRRGYKDYQSYFQAVAESRHLREEMLNRVTINVTSFFRNPDRWRELQRYVLPELAATQGDRLLSVWSAACSSGEEAYSAAMLLEEQKNVAYRVLGTDVDKRMLEKAKAGVYSAESLAQCPRLYQKKYWHEQPDGQYAAHSAVKERVRFEKRDVLKGAYGEVHDLILCRNVMIYLTEEAKRRLYGIFARALREDGVLFVGSTEQIFEPEQYGMRMCRPFFYKKNCRL